MPTPPPARFTPGPWPLVDAHHGGVIPSRRASRRPAHKPAIALVCAAQSQRVANKKASMSSTGP
ncbi:hypothetical protein, partial [Acidovorax sp. LjRoot117]|uniref:hypothetical protein n=1 Tax=Acidovorax sp. LjRoot117 TaxID=3342255 RepID=UPI003F4F6C0C